MVVTWGSTPQRPRKARLGEAVQGKARFGKARLGEATLGKARRGIDGERMAYVGVRVPDAHARPGAAGQGKAWPG